MFHCLVYTEYIDVDFTAYSGSVYKNLDSCKRSLIWGYAFVYVCHTGCLHAGVPGAGVKQVAST